MRIAGEPHEGVMATSSKHLCTASHSWDNILETCLNSPFSSENLRYFPLPGRAPLGVALNAPANCSQLLETGPYSSRHLVEGLLRELELRGARVRHSNVPWLRWQIPQGALDDAEITELMYFLGRSFQLGETANCHYSVVFDESTLSTERVALFKGLGFNSLELRIQDASDPRRLAGAIRRAVQLAADFHFDLIKFRLFQPLTGILELLDNEKASGNHRLPAVEIEPFAPTPQHMENFERLFRGMLARGFRVLGNDCFVSSESSLARAQNQNQLRLTSHGYNCQYVTDILGLGPGTASNWGDSKTLNPEEMATYISHPFAAPQAPQITSIRLKRVLDQLLCYHNLDLKYIRDRYDWDLRPVLRSAWRHLEDQERSLFLMANNQLSLTSEGVLQLSELCAKLAQHA